MKKQIVVLILGLLGVVGCGPEENPPPVDDVDSPMVVPEAVKDSIAMSAALKHYIVKTDERLKEHTIQVAGLTYMSRETTAMSSADLRELTVWLEDNLTEARKMLDNLRVAPADRVESMKADLEALINKMDQRYEVAMGLARGAYKNEGSDDEVREDGNVQEKRQSNPPAFDEDSFDAEFDQLN